MRSCEPRIELSDSIKRGEFPKNLSDYYIFQKDSVPYRLIIFSRFPVNREDQPVLNVLTL